MGLIVALDSLSAELSAAMVESLCDIVDGFKVGLPLVLSHGVGHVSLIHGICPRRLWVLDFKLADIGHVMVESVKPLLPFVDAVIAHSFVGYRGALGVLKEFLDREGKRLVLVAAMSHPGSVEVYDKVLGSIVGVVERVEPWGLVAPATRTRIIRLLRERLGEELVILAPGVGFQGAEPGEALCAGANYEIVGRLITRSQQPPAAARDVIRLQRERLRQC
ncbi:MAG: orotidine 5'-phosphate decarboxylase [Hyperthermus sp.]|nr:MAG: orotidine 5'-phosphate decarboxylase [Hyperthermus sp.]